ncbi:hypothetical protein J6590_046567 [Homalodisca vitripennis]|nr:hypothetical protein J6590_046567 [Homalodisca vitripennis]
MGFALYTLFTLTTKVHTVHPPQDGVQMRADAKQSCDASTASTPTGNYLLRQQCDSSNLSGSPNFIRH